MEDRTVEPICPECGSHYVKEWGDVQTSYVVSSVTVGEDGKSTYVDADDASDTAWDSYVQKTYACGNCNYETETIEPFIVASIERPYEVLSTSREPIKRFASKADAVAYIERMPIEARAAFYIDPNE